MRSLALLTCLFLFLLPVPTSFATTYVVHPGGSGDFPTIQAAIDAVTDADVIELSDGTFTGTGNRDLDYLGKAITIRSQGGNPESCIIDCEASETDPARGVSFLSGEGPASVLESVTITNGWVQTDVACGAGLQCLGGSNPQLIDLMITNCNAACGAGLWCENSSPTLIGCTFAGGTAATNAGGVICSGSASPSLDNCRFLDNVGGMAGGLVCNFTSAPTLVGCTFSGNSGPGAAAVRCVNTASPTFTRCTFTGNIGDGTQGVFRVEQDASVTLINSIIAFSIDAVPVICLGNGNASLTCCDLFGNTDGDWVECIADQAGQSGNLAADPEFCSTTPDDDDYWALQSDSPCATSGCGLIGAGDVACSTTATEPATWGAIKSSFRDATR